MGMHLQREIELLKKQITALSTVVEESVRKAVRSIENRDAALAEAVIKGDSAIDEQEVRVEEECLKILALHQPVAIDLRFIIAALKINNDLERMGDLAVNIAERTVFLCQREPIQAPFAFDDMWGKTLVMLRESLDALFEMDTGLARKVLASDDEVDEINRQMYRKIGRHLERIADAATNIAEDVIYMMEGTIVRHRRP
ncbi:MAG: phosphate signaling complex protein PhoU [Candidatus Eisenbacteria bacterium]|nr:phosphate signaling complex protein PhoU [Candidatus Eisenbacteria bacterium]